MAEVQGTLSYHAMFTIFLIKRVVVVQWSCAMYTYLGNLKSVLAFLQRITAKPDGTDEGLPDILLQQISIVKES